VASVVIYNTSREPIADLHLAFDIGYEQRINGLHRAWFSLPLDDPHIAECTGMNYAEIWDGDERVDLFRIVRKYKRRTTKETYYRFECEHALVTLMDNRFQATTYSGPGTTTSIGDVLDEQDTANWQLGTCDFDRQFLYKWKPGTSLLEALMSIPARFQCAYQLTWDTSSYPWTLNLIEPPATVTAYLDYSRNLKTVEKDEDFRGLYTRLYPYGAKAGADQLDITGIEPDGHNYIENNVGTYGLIVGPRWSDQRYTIAQNLYDAAVDKLAEASVPKVTYTMGAADLSRLTGVSTDQFVLGALLSVNDTDMGITIEERIVSVSKPDLDGKPGDVTIQTSNKSEEFDLRDVVRVNDLSALEMVDIPGGVVGALAASPSVAGLYASTDYLGFSDGTDWRAYFDIAGRVRLVGDGDHYLTFDINASPPLTIKSDGEWLGTALISNLIAGNLTVGMNLGTGGYIKSDNFETGVSGWRINPDGSAEFQDATIRGSLNASDLDAGTIDFATISRSGMSVIADEIANGAVTDAKIDTVSVSKLLAGDINVAWNLVAGGSVKSDNYEAGVSGWQINNSGSAEFQNATIRGSLNASDLDAGTIDFATISRSGMSVIADEIANGAVTDAKIDTVSVSKLLAGDINVAWNLIAGGSVKSDNYEAGVSGWQINNSGSAEFQNVTIRGSLNASDLDAGTIDFATISRSGMSIIADEIANGAVTDAKIDTVTAAKIVAANLAAISADLGTITAGSLSAARITSGTLPTTRTAAKCTDATANNTATIINGGLVTTGTLSLNDGSVTKAGITAVGAGDASIRFWAGATYASRGTANFRVTQGGVVYATEFQTLTDTGGTAVISGGVFQGALARLTAPASYVFTGNAPTSWTELDLSGDVGSNYGIVFLEIDNDYGSANNFAFSFNAVTSHWPGYWGDPKGCNVLRLEANKRGMVTVATSSTGKVYWRAEAATNVVIWLQAYLY